MEHPEIFIFYLSSENDERFETLHLNTYTKGPNSSLLAEKTEVVWSEQVSCPVCRGLLGQWGVQRGTENIWTGVSGELTLSWTVLWPHWGRGCCGPPSVRCKKHWQTVASIMFHWTSSATRQQNFMCTDANIQHIIQYMNFNINILFIQTFFLFIVFYVLFWCLLCFSAFACVCVSVCYYCIAASTLESPQLEFH